MLVVFLIGDHEIGMSPAARTPYSAGESRTVVMIGVLVTVLACCELPSAAGYVAHDHALLRQPLALRKRASCLVFPGARALSSNRAARVSSTPGSIIW